MEMELKRVFLKREEITVEEKRAVDFERNRKYKKIVSSINNIGMIEPLSVYREGDHHILMDGYLRLKAAEELKIKELPCFIYQGRDSYTFNAMRNELSPLQESRMLKRAISKGVDEKDLAAVLNVRVDRIRQTRDLAENLIPKARELLESNVIFRSTAEQLKRVTEERQHKILEKMQELNNYNASYAKVLVMKSPDELMRNPDARKAKKSESSKNRLYTEIKKGSEEIEFYSQRYKHDMKELMKQVVFFRTLLEREAASEYLSQNYPQMVKDVQKILARSETEVLS
jgi:ParB-like chromosome segregation protein Spo0J